MGGEEDEEEEEEDVYTRKNVNPGNEMNSVNDSVRVCVRV